MKVGQLIEYNMRNILLEKSYTKYGGGTIPRHCVQSVQIRSFFWSVFSCTWTKYRYLLRKSPYSVWIQEITDQTILRIWTLFTQWDPFLKNQNWAYLWINIRKFYIFCLIVCQVEDYQKWLKLSCRQFAFTSYKTFF